MKVSAQQIRTASLIALTIGALSYIAFAFSWIDGALLKFPSAFARFLSAYLILAVAAAISRGRFVSGVVFAASLVVSGLGITNYVSWLRHPLVFDPPERFTYISQCLLAIPLLLVVGVHSFICRHRHATTVA